MISNQEQAYTFYPDAASRDTNPAMISVHPEEARIAAGNQQPYNQQPGCPIVRASNVDAAAGQQQPPVVVAQPMMHPAIATTGQNFGNFNDGTTATVLVPKGYDPMDNVLVQAKVAELQQQQNTFQTQGICWLVIGCIMSVTGVLVLFGFVMIILAIIPFVRAARTREEIVALQNGTSEKWAALYRQHPEHYVMQQTPAEVLVVEQRKDAVEAAV